MIKFKLEKRELLFLILGAIIIFAWFLYFKDIVAPFLSNIPIILAVLLFHSAFYAGIFLISGVLTKNITRIKFDFIVILGHFIMDVIDAPYIVTKAGIINKNVDFWFTTYDAAISSIATHFVSGYNLWLTTYVFVPIAAFIVIVIIATPKRILNIFKYNVMSWNDVSNLEKMGHIIGSHTKSHLRLSDIKSLSDLIYKLPASPPFPSASPPAKFPPFTLIVPSKTNSFEVIFTIPPIPA
jgi:hypothetical protein